VSDGRIVLRCAEGSDVGAQCPNPTTQTSIGPRVRCEKCAPGKSHVCVSCGTGNFTSDVVRRRHKFIMHGEEWPLVATIDGFNVLKGIYLC
jgi:hypothetical protein